MMRFLMLYIVILFSHLLMAQSQTKEPITVYFFKPEIIKTNTDNSKSDDLVKILVRAKTTPGASVTLLGESLSIIKEGKRVRVKLSEVMTGKAKIKANNSGFFKYNLSLPIGEVRLPLLIKSESKQLSVQLNFNVEANEVKINDNQQLAKSLLIENTHKLELGLGANYVQFEETVEDPNGSYSFNAFKFPSYYLRYIYLYSQNIDLSFSYKSTPGEVVTGGSTLATTWNTLSLEGRYFPDAWSARFLGLKSHLILLGGLQFHTIPFVISSGTDDEKIVENTLQTVSLGGEVVSLVNDLWSVQMHLRLQLLAAAGSRFTVQPGLLFDGSVGAVRRLNKSWSVGGFWYGQSITYKFTSDDFDPPNLSTGSQSQLYSNMEIRGIYSFD